MSRLLRVDEAAALLGMKPATIRDWIRLRKLAIVKFGASRRAAVRIEPAEVDRLIATHRQPALVDGRTPLRLEADPPPLAETRARLEALNRARRQKTRSNPAARREVHEARSPWSPGSRPRLGA